MSHPRKIHTSFVALVCAFAVAAPAQLAKGATKFLGNCVATKPRTDFASLWTQMTPETAGKWYSVEVLRDRMVWTSLDTIYDYCLRNGIVFQQSVFAVGGANAAWISNSPLDTVRAEFEEWVATFARRYPRTRIATVVSEPRQHHRPTWAPALGGTGSTGADWVIEAFRIARKNLPNTVLILEDFDVLTTQTDSFLRIARKVKEAGFLDGVGCQAHNLESMSASALKAALAKVATLGVPIYITQYDLGIPDDSLHKDVFSRQFPVFWESPYVAGITLWGYVYGQTFIEGSGWLRNDVERPAMAWLREYLAKNPVQPMPVGGLRNDGTIQGPSTAIAPRPTPDGEAPALRSRVSKTLDGVDLPWEGGVRDALGRP